MHSKLRSEMPELLQHWLECGRGFRTPEEWVKVAERLAEEYKGVLPNIKWLNHNDYSGLGRCIKNHPHLFKHIEQDYRGGKTPEEHVKEAEQLAKKHGGVLPSMKWLQLNGHSGLEKQIRSHAHLFDHIKQHKPHEHHRAPEEHVKDAEQLAKKHGGVLPSYGSLRQNYPKLNDCMRRYPHLFEHIEQDYRGGKTPHLFWLLFNVLEKMWISSHTIVECCITIMSQPTTTRQYTTVFFCELFRFFYMFFMPEEHVKEAEQLAKKHGGVLPSVSWLINNNYSKLEGSMRKTSASFQTY